MEVTGGVITKVVPVGGTTPVENELFDLWPTIEGILERLRGPHPDRNVIDIRAQYDATLGYPIQADFIDEGFLSDQPTSDVLRTVGPLST